MGGEDGGYDWMIFPVIWIGICAEDVYVNQSALLDRGVTELKSGDKVQFLRLENWPWRFDWILVVNSRDSSSESQRFFFGFGEGRCCSGVGRWG